LTICKKCGSEEETSVHILCECEALTSLGHAYLGPFCLDPEEVKKLSKEATWNFGKGTGLEPSVRLWSTKGLF